MSGLLLLSAHRSYHLYRKETDMRKGFNQLCGIITNELGRRVTQGDAFIFINRPRTHLKLLVYEQGGFTIFYRRLLKQETGPVNMVIRRSGWIYIYLSNESAQDVYFDNLVVNLRHGPLVEQKDYYSFGMEIPGLSAEAYKPGYNQNRQKFNEGSELQSKEFSDSSGLELYDFNARMYDPQIARFLHVDPLADFTPDNTPYAYVGNNPILFCDPLGLDTIRITGQGAHKIQVRQGDVLSWTIGNTTSYYTYDPTNKEAVNGFVAGGIDDNTLPGVTVTPNSDQSEKSEVREVITLFRQQE